MSQNSLVLPTTGTVSGLQQTQNTNNALDTLNTLASGASAPSSPEAGQLWHDTTNNIIKIRSLDNTTWIPVIALNETAYLATPVALSQALTPQGRLTLSSGTSVMNSDALTQTSIYYTPHNGNILPVFNGTLFALVPFTQLTLSLNATNHPASQVFDVYASLQGGSLTLSAMAWGSNSARSATAAGKSGTGNATVTQKNGLWVNSAAISSSDSFNGSTGYAIPQYQGIYLGSFYTSAAGQTQFNLKPALAAGGAGNIVGIWNAYNRVGLKSINGDSNNWSYSGTTWRAADGSNNNRISWVDGLGQTAVKGTYTVPGANTTGSDTSSTGINLNSTTNTPAFETYLQSNVSGFGSLLVASETFEPTLGFNFLQAMEVTNNGSVTYLGGGKESLIFEGEY